MSRSRSTNHESGRRPDWFKEFAAEVLADPKVHVAIRARARDKDSHGFWEGVKTLGAAAGEISKGDVAVGGDVILRHVYEE